MLYDEFRAMNSHILLGAVGDAQQVEVGFKAARAYIAASEARFTRFSEDSELSLLNRSSGGWFIASNDLFEVVQLARQLMDQTCGLFDPSIIGALRRAGYDRSIDEIRANGSCVTRVGAPESPQAFAGVSFKPELHAIHLPPGAQIDLGGVAKGWIAEQAAVILGRYAPVCAASAGGDLFVHGLPEGDAAWPIALEDPHDPEKTIAVLRTRGGGMATSSITLRRWMQNGRERHHIIDPRTGEPAVTDWLSVTVVAPHTATAEAFAKAILIAGTAPSQALADRVAGIEFIGIKQDGSLWGSSHARELLDVTSEIV